MSTAGRLVELPSGKTAVLRERISWAARCRIEDAGGITPEVAAIYAQFADQGLTEQELSKKAAPQLAPHMAALSQLRRAKQAAQVLAWVESWDAGGVTAEVLDEMDEDDVLALIDAAEEREALRAKARDASPDGAGDPASPTPAVEQSGGPSTAQPAGHAS